MKLRSMKMSEKELKERSEPSTVLAEQPLYPWGLALNLDDDTIEKLALKTSDLDVDDTLMLVARVKVTGVSANKHQHGEHRTVQLQITDLGLGPDEGDEGAEAKAEKFYGKG